VLGLETKVTPVAPEHFVRAGLAMRDGIGASCTAMFVLLHLLFDRFKSRRCLRSRTWIVSSAQYRDAEGSSAYAELIEHSWSGSHGSGQACSTCRAWLGRTRSCWHRADDTIITVAGDRTCLADASHYSARSSSLQWPFCDDAQERACVDRLGKRLARKVAIYAKFTTNFGVTS
jgi:hypothetical protein